VVISHQCRVVHGRRRRPLQQHRLSATGASSSPTSDDRWTMKQEPNASALEAGSSPPLHPRRTL